MAPPRLPRTAIPSAPPRFAVVVRTPEAVPDRAAGADATVISVVSTYTGASPREKTTDPITTHWRPNSGPTLVRSPKPTAVTARLALISHAGRRRFAAIGASTEPAR